MNTEFVLSMCVTVLMVLAFLGFAAFAVYFTNKAGYQTPDEVKRQQRREMNFVNLTPHAIHLAASGERTRTIPPSGEVARLSTYEQGTGLIRSRSFGEVVGLPSPDRCPICQAEDGVSDTGDVSPICQYCGHDRPQPRTFIVSSLILDTINRKDCVAPAGDVRDKNTGQIIGTTYFVQTIEGSKENVHRIKIKYSHE